MKEELGRCRYVSIVPRYIRYVLLVVRAMLFLSVMGLCIVACAAVATTKPASSSDKDAGASGPVVLLTTEKLLKASQPHSVSNTGEDTFLIQVIRCRSRDANSSKVTVNTTVEKLPLDDELDSSLTSLNITVKPSNVSNHTFYVEGRFVWSSNSKSVELTAPPDYKWVVKIRCIDSSAEETVYSEPVKEVLMASQGSRSVNVPREHAANPLNLLPGTVVLPLQSETQSEIIQLLPISGPDPLPFKISSGNLVVRDDPELNQTVDKYELVWEAQNDNGSTSWAYTNIEMLKCPCKNGGVCVPPDFASLEEVRCTCTSEYQGNRCHISIWYEPRPANLAIFKKINEGGYGRIYSGKLDEEFVVVKRILFEEGDDRDRLLRKFLQEAQLLEQLSSEHPHIVGYRGAYYDKATEEPIIVMEKMKENLRRFLDKHEEEVLWQRQIEIALSVVRAVRLLHTRKPVVIHRDLTTKNVMFTYDGLVKLGDFGQSVIKWTDDEFFTEYRPGAIGYMSPESLIKPPRYNERHDIFCLGVVLLELVTLERPKRSKKNLGELPEVERRKDIIRKIPADHPLEPLIMSCLRDDPNERPDIVTLHHRLSALAEGNAEVTTGDNSTAQLCRNESHSQSKVLRADVAMDSPTTSMAATTTTTTTTIVHKQMVYVCGLNSGAPTPEPLSTSQWEMRAYSLLAKHWTTLPPSPQYLSLCTIVNNRITLIGGRDVSTGKVTNTLSTWYEEEGRWKQVLPPMPTGRINPTMLSRDNLLLVTSGQGEDVSTVLNTTDVLDLTTMKWTSPKGLNLPSPLWGHHLALCGEYLYLVGGAITHKTTKSFDTHTTTDLKHNTKTLAWRARWDDIKEAHNPQSKLSNGQEQKHGVWNKIADPPVPHHRLSNSAPGTCSGAMKRTTSPMYIFIYDESRDNWAQLGELLSGRYSHCSVPPKNTVVLAFADGGGGSLADEFEGDGGGCSGVVDLYCSCESL